MSTTSSAGVARWGMIGLTGLILTFADADAQQQPQTSPPNPYLMGTEGYNKGPRGLTSYQPVLLVAADKRRSRCAQRLEPAFHHTRSHHLVCSAAPRRARARAGSA
jgi:hypothetical protein